MAKRFKFELRRGSKHDKCPACGHMSFKPYVSVVDQKPAGEQYGRCERLNKCDYKLYPKGVDVDTSNWTPPPLLPDPDPDYIDKSFVESTFKAYQNNNFFMYVVRLFGNEKSFELAATYNIGTTKNGSTLFWQQDNEDRFRTGKIILYGQDGKRNKDFDSWYCHKKIKPGFILKQCFFGEHLLKLRPNDPVALCESEKTAVLMSVIRPEFVWLASGGSENLQTYKFYHLHNREVHVFPDQKQFKKWKEKTAFLANRIMNTEVEEAFFRNECEEGADIWDIVLINAK